MRYLQRVNAAQHFWVDVAHRGAAVYHPALVELVDRDSTLVNAEVGQQLIDDLRRAGFSNEYGPNVRLPVALV
jgi:hypothetical protein